MSKYKLYKNRRTQYHPAVEIEVLEDGTWLNIEVTSSPTNNDSFEQFEVNPNPDSDRPSYFRKYLRKDKLRHRGDELKKYQLVVSDEIKIDVFVALIKNKNGGKLINEALSHKGRTPSETIKSNNYVDDNKIRNKRKK